jgi:hypothetical protein
MQRMAFRGAARTATSMYLSTGGGTCTKVQTKKYIVLLENFDLWIARPTCGQEVERPERMEVHTC